MEDPEIRDQQFRARLQDLKRRADALKEQWALPAKYEGFWQELPFTSKYHADKENVERAGTKYERYLAEQQQSEESLKVYMARR